MMLNPALDLFPLAAAVMAAVCCALLGNFLVLRRISLMGDAMSHSVLPGLVIAVLITGSRSAPVMFVGAAFAGVATAVMVELIKRLGRVEPGAAMGVVFTTMFAAGVLILEQTDTSAVHLDVEHALMGNLESLIWFRAEGWHSLLDPEALATLPDELFRIVTVCALVIALMLIFWRWLKIATFDENFAEALGIPAGALGFGLVVTAAIAAGAAFDAVGSIIVIAMFICPPAAARLMTNNLTHQVWWSVAFATLSASLGYVLAGYGPLWFGAHHAVSAAGMIATVSGVILGLACLLGPCRQRVGVGRGLDA